MLDINGATVRGVVACKGCRALWHEGVLYVVRSTTDVVALTAPTAPRKMGGGWQVNLGESFVTVQKPGCNCKKNKALGAMTLEQIVGLVPVDA